MRAEAAGGRAAGDGADQARVRVPRMAEAARAERGTALPGLCPCRSVGRWGRPLDGRVVAGDGGADDWGSIGGRAGKVFKGKCKGESACLVENDAATHHSRDRDELARQSLTRGGARRLQTENLPRAIKCRTRDCLRRSCPVLRQKNGLLLHLLYGRSRPNYLRILPIHYEYDSAVPATTVFPWLRRNNSPAPRF
jgi:hypothetical protein